MESLKQNIEALVFACENSITVEEIKNCLLTVYGWEISSQEVKDCLAAIKEKFDGEEYSFTLNEIANGFRFLSKPEYYNAIQVFIAQKNKKRLSTAALETLSIIAYRQPISKAEVEHIRGVNCDYSVQKLLEKELIEIEGKSDGPGKPLLYATSKNFMDYFGLKNSTDLPKLKDIILPENTIGAPTEMNETTFETLSDENTHTEMKIETDHNPVPDVSGDVEGTDTSSASATINPDTQEPD